MYIRWNRNFMSTDMQCPGDGTCSNQGTCDVSTGTCTCNPGFHGPECSKIGKLNHFLKWWCHHSLDPGRGVSKKVSAVGFCLGSG